MLRAQPIRVLVNTIDSSTIVNNQGASDPIIIAGITIPKNSVSAPSIQLGSAGTKKKVTLTFDITGFTAADIEEAAIAIVRRPNKLRDLDNIKTQRKTYVFQLNAGQTATAAVLATGVFTEVGNDKAVGYTVTNASAGVMTIEGPDAYNDFDVYSVDGLCSVAVTTAWAEPQLTYNDLKRLFAVRHGFEGADPIGPISGASYEKMSFKFATDMQHLNHPHMTESAFTEVEFYVNKSDADYQAHWVDKLAGLHATTLATAKASITGLTKADKTAAFTSVGSAQITANP